jgi:YbbR domain-containing protein
MNRIGLKLACLVVSIVIWIQVASTTTTEATLRLPVTLVNLPPGTTVAGSEIPQTVAVRLQGSKLRLLTHSILNRVAGHVVIDLEGYQAGETVIHDIAPSDVRSELKAAAVTPPVRLRLLLDREVTRVVPVRVRLQGQLRGSWQLLEPVAAVPDTAAVTGPQRFMVGLDSVATQPLDLDRVDQSARLERTLVLPSPYLVAEPARVTVVVTVARVEGRTLANIPVVPLVDADQGEVAISPPVADVMVRGPADSIRALVPARISVTVAVGGLEEGIHHLRGQVTHPDWLELVAVEPEVFMVVVGDLPQASSESERP